MPDPKDVCSTAKLGFAAEIVEIELVAAN